MLKIKYFALLLTCSFLLSSFALGQDNNGVTRYLMTVDYVKPGKIQQWKQLQKDAVIPALKKAGVKSRKVYHTVLGDTTEYISYQLFPDYAAFDKPDALEQVLGLKKANNLKQQLNDCLISSKRQLMNNQNDFLTDPGDAPALLTSSYRATAGRSGDYMKFLREELLQPVKKAVAIDYIEGFSLMLTNQGGEVGIYVMNMHYKNFDALDGPTPVAYVLGREGTMEFIRKGAGLITPLGQIIREYQPELSF